MSILNQNYTYSALSLFACILMLNIFSEEIPYFLLQLPYIFNLLFDRAQSSLDRNNKSSKPLQLLSVSIFVLSRPFITQAYFQQISLGQLYGYVVELIVFSLFFYMIPFSYWQYLKNHHICGNIINSLDAFGAAGVMMNLVSKSLINESYFQYILIVLLSNAFEAIMSWIMYKIEGSDQSLQSFLVSIKYALIMEVKSCFLSIIFFIIFNTHTKSANILHKFIFPQSSNSIKVDLLQFLNNYIYVEESIKQFRLSISIPQTKQITNISSPKKKVSKLLNYRKNSLHR